MRQKKLDIGALTLITSCGCNLNCEYCHIAKGVNSDSARLQRETIQALKDGSFLENVKKVLYKLDQSPSKIGMISFWGQEPTLTIHHITENMETWMETFPNLRGIMFSTNAIDHGDRLVDFLATLDKHARNQMNIEIQFSFDGEESTNNIRNADSKRIFDTVSFVINECNKIKFNKLNISFVFHGVVSLDLLHRLDTVDKIETFLSNLNEWTYTLSDLSFNKAITVDPIIGLGLENPVDASALDGMKLAEFYRIACRLNPNIYKCYNMVAPPDTLTGQYARQVEELFRMLPAQNLPELMQVIRENPDFYNMTMENMSNLLYCGNSYGELKLMYDGTIINCQNHIYDRDVNYISDEPTLENAVKRGLATHSYYVNPLTDSDEQIAKHFELFRVSKEECFAFIFHTTISLMYWLAKAHQIDESYNDLNKIIEHAFLLAYFNCCYYNNYVKTGSMFLRATGYLRFFCNGFMDEILNNERAWTVETYDK